MIPTAGGQYHWVSVLAPPSSRRFLSYVTGEVPFGGPSPPSWAQAYVCRLDHRVWLGGRHSRDDFLCEFADTGSDGVEQSQLRGDWMARNPDILGGTSRVRRDEHRLQ